MRSSQCFAKPVCVHAQSRATLCNPVKHQALPSVEFSRQEHWNGLPVPTPGKELDLCLLCLRHWRADSLSPCYLGSLVLKKKKKRTNPGWLPDSALICKELGHHHPHPYSKKNLDKLKTNLFWDPSENWFHRVNHHCEIWTYSQRWDLPTPSKSYRSQKLTVTLNANSDDLLAAEWADDGLACGWEIMGTQS